MTVDSGERRLRPDFLYYSAGKSPYGDSADMRIFLGGITRESFLQEHKQAGLVDYDQFKLDEARRAVLLPTVAKVLDFDGTMFNTGPIQQAANPLTFNALGVDVTVTPEMAASFRGKSDEVIFAMLLGSENQHLVAEGIRVRNDLLLKLATEEADLAQYLLPGMDEFVRLMRTTHQKVGIATASPDAYIYEFLRRVEIDGQPISDVFPEKAVIGSDTIRQIFTGTNTEPRFKPDPFSVHLAASRVEEFAGSPIFYGGDSLVDGYTLRNDPRTTGVLISGREKTRRDLESEFAGNENVIFGESLLLLVS